MKCTGIVVMALVLLASFPGIATSQEPVVDLAVTNLTYTTVSEDSALFEAEVQLATRDSTGQLITEVQFYLDAEPAGSVVYDVTPTAISPCQEFGPPCDGYCSPAEINGQTVDGFCATLTWGDPPHDDCVCMYLVVKPHIEPVPGSPYTLTATVDPYDGIPEMDEANNSMTINIGPTSVDGTVWGAIKSLYR